MADLIIKLQGGLGNQMFQYAFGYALSRRQNQKVYYDLSWFNKVKKRPKRGATVRELELEVFNLPLLVAANEQLRDYFPGVWGKLFGKKPDVIKEPEISLYTPELLLQKQGYFDGYFQTEKYFKDYRNEILQAFMLKNLLNEENRKMLSEISKVNAVSLHVRRGDYLLAKNQAYHGLCGLDYYKKAVDYIAGKIEKPHFFLFSDDLPWVAENLKLDYPATMVDINIGRNSFYDMWLMKHCRHNIVANSSFSWWGAWLNETPDKIVIAPQKWSVTKEISGRDMVPESWIRL